MRQSIASLAVIRQTEAGIARYLAQWSERWGAYAFVGGHKKDGETHRACLVREIAEELRLLPAENDPDLPAAGNAGLDPNMTPRFWVAPTPLGRLDYEAFSVAAGERTRYLIELFEVRLSDSASARAIADPANRWLSEAEIERGRCDADRQPISDTVRHHVGWLNQNALANPPIYWLIAAERKLREAMAKELAASQNDQPLWEESAFVAERLRGLFPQAHAVVVQARFEGFRRKVRPHKMMVEIVTRHEEDEPPCDREPARGVWNCREVHFVKIGSESDRDPKKRNELEQELAGWRRCRPHGSHDSILSSLRGVRDPAGALLGLIYSDAHSTLGGAGISTLEEAIVGCVQHDAPRVESIKSVLRLLYGRLNERLYSRSFVPETSCHFATGARGEHWPVRRDLASKDESSRTLLRFRIERALEEFDETDSGKGADGERSSANLSRDERRRLRREALAWFTQHEPDSFVDPFDLCKVIIDRPELVPRLLVGAAHGDLHARNALVSRLEDEVGSVAVFDYSDLDLGNHIGWDFVEMEVEAKIRLYPLFFEGAVGPYVAQVAAFEEKLNAWTEAFHRGKPTPDLAAALVQPSERRCAEILLEIRGAAQRCLGLYRHRGNEWLEEYYFLLCCYGAYSSRFDNYNRNELLGAYVSAGMAGRRLSWPRDSLTSDIRRARDEAVELRAQSSGQRQELVERAQSFAAGRPTIGHHAGFEFARTWVQGDCLKKRPFFEAAAELLLKLGRKFPHVLQIFDYRLLALLELNEEAEVEKVIDELRRRNIDLTYEIICRHAKLFKKRGEENWPEGVAEMPDSARRQFEQSLRIYREAWQIERHYYPGINVAGLCVLLGQKEEGRALAETVRQIALARTAEDHWAAITEADALFLRGEDEKAVKRYRDVLPHFAPRDAASVRRQIRLLLRVAGPSTRERWKSQWLPELFGVD